MIRAARGIWKMVFMTMGFEFRLQRVLKYRQGQKKLAEEELSRRQRELDLLQEELDSLLQEELRLLKLCRRRAAKTVDVQLLRNIESYRSFLQACVEDKQRELSEYCRKVEEQRRVVVDFWRGCQVLEKLKEKNFEFYREEEKVKEQHFHDEISLYQYLRKRE